MKNIMALQREGFMNASEYGWDYFSFVVKELSKPPDKGKASK